MPQKVHPSAAERVVCESGEARGTDVSTNGLLGSVSSKLKEWKFCSDMTEIGEEWPPKLSMGVEEQTEGQLIGSGDPFELDAMKEGDNGKLAGSKTLNDCVQ